VKLPDLNLVKDSDARFLYEYDLKELFNLDERNVMRFRYETKLNQVLDVICNKVKKTGVVIDVGCAQGNYALSIAAKGVYSVGVDLRRSFLKYAKMKVETSEKQNVDFLVANAEYLPFKSQSAACIYLGEFLEHLSEPLKVLEEVKRVLSVLSFAIVTTPNVERFRKTKSRTYVETCLVPKNALDKLKFGADTHVFEFKRAELLSLLSVDFEVVFFKYLWPISPISFLYKMPFSSRTIREIETALLGILPLGRKLASDMICIVASKHNTNV
jgi:ubiquinone/menaquinone biosynthesis C-methylase UbiE